MLSDYVPKSDLVVSSADLQSKQNVSDDSNIYLVVIAAVRNTKCEHPLFLPNRSPVGGSL